MKIHFGGADGFFEVLKRYSKHTYFKRQFGSVPDMLYEPLQCVKLWKLSQLFTQWNKTISRHIEGTYSTVLITSESEYFNAFQDNAMIFHPNFSVNNNVVWR